MEEKIMEVYSRIEAYAAQMQLSLMAEALPYIRDKMSSRGKNASAQARYLGELLHVLEVCQMLINLHPGLDKEEEDVLLTAAILHIYPENFSGAEPEILLERTDEAAVRIREIIGILEPGSDLMDEDQKLYYEQIQENPLALLIALADRGNIVQNLHRFSTWNAHRYIDETKACYYPMCIYGKEHYHVLLAPISVLMEKLRSLIEVSEILLQRYEVREAELIQDILALREENATIKGIIAKFQAQQGE